MIAALWIAYFIRKMFIMKRFERNRSGNAIFVGTHVRSLKVRISIIFIQIHSLLVAMCCKR